RLVHRVLNVRPTPRIHTPSLHDALPIFAAHFWPGRFRARDQSEDELRLFEVEPGSKVLARCRWQANRAEHPTLVMWHGMEGSTADRKSTRLNSSHEWISYAVFCLKKKNG